MKPNSLLSVPVMHSRTDAATREIYEETFRAAGVDRAVLAFDRTFFFFEDERESALIQLADNVRYFREKGYETAVWVQAFGFGNPLTDKERAATAGLTKIRSVTGKEAGDAFCPSDPAFLDRSRKFLSQIAKTRPDAILLDDDLCLSVRPGLGCFCERHKAMLADALGTSDVSDETLCKRLFTGSDLSARKVWKDVMGRTLTDYCRAMREAVDTVDPAIRLGFCAGYSSFSFEGVRADKLAKILAGNTKPLLRLTGAPYWAAPCSNRFPRFGLNTYIECAREQIQLCRDSGIELMSEEDSYPRPRYQVPANYLECFDAVMHANGGAGALKYLMDYFSTPGYETGYSRAHLNRLPLYRAIDEAFDGMETVGVGVREDPEKIDRAVLPEVFPGEKPLMQTFFSSAATLLTAHGIPTTYEDGAPVEIVFGENARGFVPEKKKYILDFAAAKLLLDAGFDVGLRGFSPAPVPVFERFGGERVLAGPRNEGSYFLCSLDPRACVESTFEAGEQSFPASYSYRAPDGTDYLVFTFSATEMDTHCGVFRSYCRQSQLWNFIGNDFAPHVLGAPGLYSLCKRKPGKTSLLLVNLSPDDLIDAPVLSTHSPLSVSLPPYHATVIEFKV